MSASAVTPAEVHDTLRAHVLVDGYDLVLDTAASRGSWLVDALDGTRYLDVFTFYASSPLGMNHPALADDEEFRAQLLEVALNKPANSDVYTTHYAEFVRTLHRVMGEDRAALAASSSRAARWRWRTRSRRRSTGSAAGTSRRPAAPSLGTKVLHLTRRVPRPQRLHALAHQHRPRQDRALPEVRRGRGSTHPTLRFPIADRP